ncbi:Pde11, partial [Symbiodinium microadriaticum]
IKQIDGIVEHLSRTPCNLLESDVALHLCNRRACRLLDAERIAVFVLQPGGEFIHRYTTNSPTVDKIRVGDAESVAEYVIRHGTAKRYNNLKTSKNLYFNSDVDSGGDTNVKRVLCCPMREEGKGRIIGAIELLNRADGEKFSEVDELYNSLYGEMSGGIAPLALNCALPEKETICALNPLDVGEVIYHTEVVFRDALQCAKVKVYVPGHVVGEASDIFLSLEAEAVSMKAMKRSQLAVKTTPIHSGIVGIVAQARTPYLAANPPTDPYFNPQVDIDSPSNPFYCIPILDFNDQLIACIEAEPSPLSPPLQVHQDKKDPCALTFENASQWLGFTLSVNLAIIIALVGKPSCRPDVHLPPITITEKLCKVPLNLRPSEEYVKKRRGQSGKSVTLVVGPGDAIPAISIQPSDTHSMDDGQQFLDFASFDNEDSIMKQEEYEQKIESMRVEIANLKAASGEDSAAVKAKYEKELDSLRAQNEQDMAEQAKAITLLQEQVASLQEKVQAMEIAEDASVLSDASSAIPEVDLKLGDGNEWQHTTGATPLVMSNAKWSPLTVSGRVDQTQILVDSFAIRVKDSSAATDHLLGKAYMSLEMLIDQTNCWQMFSGQLVDKDGGEQCGTYAIRARFRLPHEECTFDLPVDDDFDLKDDVVEPECNIEQEQRKESEIESAGVVEAIDDSDPDAGHLE